MKINKSAQKQQWREKIRDHITPVVNGVGWDGMKWDEMKWGEMWLDEMRWDERRLDERSLGEIRSVITSKYEIGSNY